MTRTAMHESAAATAAPAFAAAAPPAITVIRFTPSPAIDRPTGLLGFLILEIAGLLRICDATVRRSRAGALYVALPAPVDRYGRRRGLITPINRDARAAIDAAVLEALTRAGHLPVLGDAVLICEANPDKPDRALAVDAFAPPADRDAKEPIR